MFNTALVGMLSTVSPTTKVLTLEGTGTVEYAEPSWPFDPDKYYLVDIALSKAPSADTTIPAAEWCYIDWASIDPDHEDLDYSVCNDVIGISNLHSYNYGDAIPIVTKVTTEVDGVFVNWTKHDPYEQMLYGKGDTYILSQYRGGAFFGLHAYGDKLNNDIVLRIKDKVGQVVPFKIKVYLETNVVRKIVHFAFDPADNIDTTQRFVYSVVDENGNDLYGGGGVHYLADAGGNMVIVGKRGDSGKLRVRSYDGMFDSGLVDITFDEDGSEVTLENIHFVQTYYIKNRGSDKYVTYLYTFKVSQTTGTLSTQLIHDRSYVNAKKDYFQFAFDKKWKGKTLYHYIESGQAGLYGDLPLGSVLNITLAEPL